MRKFTVYEVVERGEDVKREWLEMAGEWLTSGENDYLTEGFVGWNDRGPATILIDFHINGRLETPLTDTQFQFLLSFSDNRSADQVLIGLRLKGE